ncbi:MAG: hypothetical protein GY719_37060 [bacterium]|nr:hypothetical protein [bacterium]
MRSIGSRIRIQSVEEARASLDTFADGVADKLDGNRPASVAFVIEPGSTYRALFQDVDGRLASVQERLVKAEDAHVRKLIRISDLRRESEELTLGLYDEQVAVRRILAGLYGPDRSFELAAIEGFTPQDQKDLSDQVDLTVKFLKEPEIEVPSAKAAGVAIDFGSMADSLETGLGDIVRVGGELARARKAASKTVIVKRMATTEFDAVFPWAAQTVEGAFRMAGERDLADRIRTSRRRVTRRQAAELDEADQAEAADEADQAEPSPDGSEAEEATPSSSEAAEETQP